VDPISNLQWQQPPVRREIFQLNNAVISLSSAMKKLKFVVERHRDGYVAYPLGLKGAVVGQGESYESALADAKSAAAFHIESFGKEAFDDQDDVMEAFVTEASLTMG
jgi:predicted RNase H-like HicB family nuclease